MADPRLFTVACPQCNAEPHQYCVDESGAALRAVHTLRFKAQEDADRAADEGAD